MAQQKYSLWTMPSGQVAARFSQLISDLAEQYGSPTFPPHVTLLGSIEADEEVMVVRCRALALRIQPFTIRLSGIGALEQYFRALFVNVQPSDGVLAAYQEARKMFPEVQKPAYQPHLSLLYGDFPPDTKERTIETLGHQLAGEFEVDALHLYTTGGNVDTWHEMGTFMLQT